MRVGRRKRKRVPFFVYSFLSMFGSRPVYTYFCFFRALNKIQMGTSLPSSVVTFSFSLVGQSQGHSFDVELVVPELPLVVLDPVVLEEVVDPGVFVVLVLVVGVDVVVVVVGVKSALFTSNLEQ